MNSSHEGVSGLKTAVLSFLYVALGAIFLFVFTHAAQDKEFQVSFKNAWAAVASNLEQGQAVGSQSFVPETPELVLLEKTGLVPVTPPVTVTPRVLGAIMGPVDVDIRPEVTRYSVEEGDTLKSIAEKFNISLNTLLWANDLTASSKIKKEQELVVLPVSGVLHLVRQNDTVSEIASWYKADAQEIIDFNKLSSADEVFAGDLLIIPNGTMRTNLPQGRLTPVANSYFIYPIPAPYRVTQGLHPYNAIDFSNGSCGESIYAAAGGTVQRTGYTSLGGNYVRILHPNGVVTYYGHLSSILVAPGARVLQGQVIGYTGYTGYTIPKGPGGCHLHFEVRGAANPFAK